MRYIVIFFFCISFGLTAQEPGDLDYVFTSLMEADKNADFVYNLSLTKKKLVEFPGNLKRFKNLKVLDLSKNKISLLPSEIGELKSLEELDLSKNKIYKLPPQIKEWKNLKVLLMPRNDVEAIPKEIGELVNLETLDLWSNNVKSVHPNIKKLSNLKLLDLQGMLLPDEMKKELVKWLPEAKIQFSGGCDCGF